jgi:DNA uptake protein ComE-like DNA-binding protein
MAKDKEQLDKELTDIDKKNARKIQKIREKHTH